MKLKNVVELLEAEVLSENYDSEQDILAACGSDLMSDVLAFVKDQALLLTGLINPQVVRTAEMMDMKAIVFVRGKSASSEIIELAAESGITVLSTSYPLYVSCGKLYAAGLK